MTQPQKHPLRVLSEQEERELQRLVKATSERLDVVRRATALLAVAAGQAFTQAAYGAGLKSGDGVGKLVKRFNEHGLAALSIAAGAGRKPTYTSEQQARILAEVQRQPERKEDGTATWSLSTLQAALRTAPDGLPTVSTFTIWVVLHDAGFRWGKDRSWCDTGTVIRKRKSGPVTVTDPDTVAKKR